MPLFFNDKMAIAGYCCHCKWLHPLYNDLPAGCMFVVPRACSHCQHEICGECGPVFGPSTFPVVRRSRPATPAELESIAETSDEPWTVEWHPIH